MKTYLLIIIFSTCSLFSFSQGGVGINETGAAPDTSAILDISSSNKGLLIPRLSLTDTADITTISGATTSLIVHNTNDTMQGGNGIGLYQWNGSKWIKLIAPENGPGSSGQVLTSQGTGKAAAWKTGGGGGSPGGNCIPAEVTNETLGSTTGQPCSGTGCGDAVNLLSCITQCDTLTHNGNTDWRVPSTEEAFTLYNGAPGVPGNTFWTLTPFDGVSNRVFLVNYGGALSYAAPGNSRHCRCVR